jgi:aarF domain-containing kinase
MRSLFWLALLWNGATGTLLHSLPVRPWAIREAHYYEHHHQHQKQRPHDKTEDGETREDAHLDDYCSYFEISTPQLGSLASATPYVLAVSAVAGIGKVISDPSIRRVLYFWRHGGPIIAHYKFTQFWLERVRGRAEHSSPVPLEERHAIYETLHNRYAEPTLQLILHLRGLYVKVGQVLSSRSDFMPRQYLERLAMLQDDVPPLPMDKVESIVQKSLRSEYGLAFHDVFETMDGVALGSASIGQVHRAVLQKDWFSSHQQRSSSSSSSSSYRGGRVVACKVMHPGAQACFARDFSVFRWVCRLVLPGLRPVLEELERRIMTEFNYRDEANNLCDVRNNIATSPYAGRVCVPQPLWELTCPDVLVMEMLEGKKLLESIQEGVTQVLGGDPVLVAKFREHQKKKLLHALSPPIASSSTSQSTDSFIQSLNLKTKLKLFLLRNRYHKYIKLLVRVHGYTIFQNGCFNGGSCHVYPVNLKIVPSCRPRLTITMYTAYFRFCFHTQIHIPAIPSS